MGYVFGAYPMIRLMLYIQRHPLDQCMFAMLSALYFRLFYFNQPLHADIFQ